MSEIKLGSTSYPYLAVAKHYNVPYVKVLEFIEQRPAYVQTPWQVAALNAEAREMERRRK